MEQATNQFNKGLQMDTHPMVQSNDSLTDCLNGTLITMNGNEVILQNDMGNRRVNNAFLPPGYQPIGIKEYGGVIYIAAYNPITNQSQIGSFPSPQKKFNNINSNGELDFDYFLSEENQFKETFQLNQEKSLILSFIKSDTQFVLLTEEDSTIYPGDKFVVYCSNLKNKKEQLTNYNNVEGDKIITPKNKDYTLFLGVLNSQNKFMDVTPTLQRWDGNNIINFQKKYDYDVSEKFKFNTGYFIPESFDNIQLEETIQDANFIKARQSLPINTYSSKLIGPLYLKAYLNHVENFDYNITGYKKTIIDENGNPQEVVRLIIDGYFTYNCQDKNSNKIESNTPYQSSNIQDTESQQHEPQSSTDVIINGNDNVYNTQGYSNIGNDNANSSVINVGNDPEDSLMYQFNYNTTQQTFESMFNVDKEYVILTQSDTIQIMIIQDEDFWSPPYSVNNAIYIPSKSKIAILEDNRERYIDEVEINGRVQNLKIYDGFGQQFNNTWKALEGTPRYMSFTCDYGYLDSIKVKTRDISIRQRELEISLLPYYGLSSHTNGISDFKFNEYADRITFYNPLDNITDRFNDNPMYYGSINVTFKDPDHDIKFVEDSGEYKILLYEGTEFTIDVIRNYYLANYFIYMVRLDTTAEIESGEKRYRNGVWDDRGSFYQKNTVTFKCTKSGYLNRIQARHTGICGIPYDTTISRTFTNYKILEKLQRNGNSVPRGEALNLTLISYKTMEIAGFGANMGQRTVEVTSLDGKPIAYGHFEIYDLQQSELDKIQDGRKWNVYEYYALKFKCDELTNNNLIDVEGGIIFHVKQDAFGNYYFYEYTLDYENPEYVKIEDCFSNKEFTYQFNLI